MENSLTLSQQAILVEAEYLRKRDQFSSIEILFLYDRLIGYYGPTKLTENRTTYKPTGAEGFVKDLRSLEDKGYLEYWKCSSEISLNEKGMNLAKELLKLPMFAPEEF